MVSLEIRDIIKLIRVIKETGIQEFNGLGLHIIVNGQTKPTQTIQTERQIKASDEKAAIIATESLRQETAESVEDRIQLLLIEDPAEYERLLMERELEDASIQHTGIESAI